MKVKDLFQVADYTRRYFLKRLNKNYTEEKLKKRKGKCKKCGKCCEGCPHLDKKTNLCKVYKNRPRLMCHVDFPLDKMDQRLWKVEKVCGYKFD